MQMDEIFFNEFGTNKKQFMEVSGLHKLSDKDYSRILIKSKAIKFNKINLFENGKNNRKKKRKFA